MDYEVIAIGIQDPASCQSVVVAVSHTSLASATGNAFAYRTRIRALKKALKVLPERVSQMQKRMKEELRHLEELERQRKEGEQ
jgi:hypothetical protein